MDGQENASCLEKEYLPKEIGGGFVQTRDELSIEKG